MPEGKKTEDLLKSWPRKVTVGSCTVKVYEVSHPTNRSGKAYVVAWSTPTGRKTQKFARPGAAIEEARLVASQLAQGRVEGADMTRGDRDELQAARRLTGDVPLLAALAEWAKARTLTQGQLILAAESWRLRHSAVIEQATVSVVLERFLKAKKKQGFNTKKNHGSIFNDIEAALGTQAIGSIGKTALQAYLDAIVNSTTRNTHRKRMVTLWRWARSRDLLPRDLETEADRTDRAQEKAPEIGIITPAVFLEWLLLVRADLQHDLAALVVSGFCGLRRSEIHGQQWKDINLEEGHLRVTSAKRGTPSRRLVPLPQNAVQWLLACRDRKGNLCEGMAVDRARKAGIAAGLNLPENCTRHSYISYAVAKTKNIPAVALDAGNSPTIIHKHYRELVTAATAEKWFALLPTSESVAGAIVAMDRKVV
jgi:integrase